MTFAVNDSPFAGKEGKFVTSRQLRDRLYKETLKDVSLRVSDGETTDEFKVAGRGEMHLSILIENMRREGYEMTCSNPRVLYKEIDGVKCEPMERVTLDVPTDYVGAVVEKLGQRKGDLLEMNPVGNRMRIEYSIPSRCLFGYRSEFLTATRGEGIMNSMQLLTGLYELCTGSTAPQETTAAELLSPVRRVRRCQSRCEEMLALCIRLETHPRYGAVFTDLARQRRVCCAKLALLMQRE